MLRRGLINLMLVEGQLEGSVVGGMGQALYEDVIVEKGQVMNPSFLDYGLPTFLEMPQIEAIEVETDDPIGPFGAREADEGIQLSPTPDIVNAVYDAIGVDFMELPLTPEKILAALEENREGENQIQFS
jgi:CO/xanthine dehydrogenase Mo-binding subunit